MELVDGKEGQSVRMSKEDWLAIGVKAGFTEGIVKKAQTVYTESQELDDLSDDIYTASSKQDIVQGWIVIESEEATEGDMVTGVVPDIADVKVKDSFLIAWSAWQSSPKVSSISGQLTQGGQLPQELRDIQFQNAPLEITVKLDLGGSEIQETYTATATYRISRLTDEGIVLTLLGYEIPEEAILRTLADY